MNAKTAIALLLVFLSQASAAEDVAFACPSVLPSAPTPPWSMHTATSAPSGDPSGRHSAAGMALFAGHPRDDASLVPDSDRSVGRDARESTWVLSGEHWVGCAYRGTPAMLVQRVPAQLDRCRMLYRARKDYTAVSKFVCTRRAN